MLMSMLPGSWQVWTPNMYNMQLWETSGHAANYKENMFVFEVRYLVRHDYNWSDWLVLVMYRPHGELYNV